MKKTVCNVLNKVTMPVMYEESGEVVHELGLFETKKQANIAASILTKLLVYASEDLGVEYFSSWDIEEVYIPEQKMKEPLIQMQIMNSVDDFIASNSIALFYAEKYGEESLKEVVNYTTELVNNLHSIPEDGDEDVK